MKLFRNFSIDKKLSIVVILLVFSALLFSSGFVFFRTFSSFESVVENNSKEINKQIILNYESHFEEIREVGRYIELETSKLNNANQTNLFSLYNSFATLNADIISISLVDEAGIVRATSYANYVQNLYLTEHEWFSKAIENEGIYFFFISPVKKVFLNTDEEVINASKRIEFYINGEEHVGVLLIELSTLKIDTISKQSNLGEGGHIILFDDQDELIYSSDSNCIDSTCLSNVLARDLIIGGKFVEINGTEMYMSVNTIQGTRWRIATFINVEIISSSQSTLLMMLFYVFITTIVLSIVGTSILTKQITKPLNQLKAHMLEIQNSDHLYREVDIKGQKEVVILAQAYNDMIKEIRRLLDRLVEEQNEKRKTELIALQTQINPHFLYNTLDSIVWLAEQKDNEHVIEMVVALSRFFRISISGGKDVIPIEKELQHAQYYIQIQQIRYSNKFDYTFDIDQSILGFEVVKLVLQPLIENAIQHGIHEEYKGLINIKAYQENGFINFEVSNNGYGLTKQKIDEIYEKISSDNHESVGLKNVVQRLKLYYGPTSGIEIISVLDKSTTFRIFYPIQGGGI
ncbi:MAG: histidine kinase [Candidatus Izemoplasmatales bacterium]